MMKYFNDLKVGIKLSILILVSFLSLITVGGIGYYYLQESTDQMNVLYQDRLIPNDEISELIIQIESNRATMLEMVLTTDMDMDKRQQLKELIGERKKKANNSMEVLKKVPMDPKAADYMARIEQAQNNYRPIRDEIIELVLQNRNAEARALSYTKLPPVSKEYLKEVEMLDQHYSDLAKKANDDNMKAGKRAIQIIAGFTSIMFIIIGVMGLLISRMITRPLHSLVLVCDQLASGDFRDHSRKLLRKDEIGQVANALAEMRTSIRNLMKRIGESSEQVAASSEELTASAEQSAQASNQIATSISDVANGTSEQLAAADEASSTVEQMSVAIQQVAASTNEVSEQSNIASEKAKNGDKVVEKAIGQMNLIADTTHAFAENISALNEKSQDIGQIVEAISGIAGQTNLLALNAAIEAARAGEHGRGFAVVADEVRKLAEESREATKKISKLISEIQVDTGNAVAAMNNSSNEVRIGTEVVTAAGTAFREILELVTLVSSRVIEISAAIQELASGSQQIVNSIKKIDALSNKSAGDAQSVSAATQQQLASMQEIASSSQALADLAQDLQVAVSKFQV